MTVLSNAIYDDLCQGCGPAEASCTMAEMIPAFQELFEPDQSRLFALIGRIKRLFALGACADAASGRGRTAHFKRHDVWTLAILMELTEIGFSPAAAIQSGARGDLVSRNGTVVQIDYDTLLKVLYRHLPHLFERKVV